jgi:hypothetical protein
LLIWIVGTIYYRIPRVPATGFALAKRWRGECRAPGRGRRRKKKRPIGRRRRIGREKNLAATYSRGIYKTTTIGKTVFDGRVRNGNGSGHSFIATKKLLKNHPARGGPGLAGVGDSLKTAHRRQRGITFAS